MILQSIVGYVLTVAIIIILMPVAIQFGLLAKPGKHRHHESPTPLIGGIAIFVSVIATCKLFSVPLPGSLLSAMGLVIVFGAADDKWELPFLLRFVIQGVSAVILIEGGLLLNNLGYLFSSELFTLGRWSYVLTVFAIVGVINAVNMIDGLDGLVGSVIVVSLLFVIYLLYSAGITNSISISLIVLSAVVGFLLFNLRFLNRKPAKVFMGDAGSMMLGVFIAWLLISNSQGPNLAFPPVVALWLLALPLFDTVGVMLRRLGRKQSPFHSDRLHTHHLLLNIGLSVNQVLLLMLSMAIALGIVGIMGYQYGISDQVMFMLFFGLFVVYIIIMEFAQRGLHK